MTVEEDIKRAVECMRKGGVILYPTDTVWGIGCDATNPEAVKKVYEIKKRDDSKALICLIDSADALFPQCATGSMGFHRCCHACKAYYGYS